MPEHPTIGLIVPYSTDDLPPECSRMYPGVRFVARGVGVERLAADSYEAAMRRVPAAAAALAQAGVDAIMVIGTSLTFYRGAEFNAKLIERLRAETGLPVGTMSSAVVEGLRAVGAERLALATAYGDEVNGYLRDFLAASGFEVLALEAFGLIGFSDPHGKTEAEIVALGHTAVARAPASDGLLISCGGLDTLAITQPLEDALRLPVVSSMPAGLWSAVRLVGHSGRLAGHGRLFAQSTASSA